MRTFKYGRVTAVQVLVFCFVDLLATNFLLAAIVTYAVSKGLSIVRFKRIHDRRHNANQLKIIFRFVFGRSNLATKTLIDRRFLI